jgi:hypothetical protein
MAYVQDIEGGSGGTGVTTSTTPAGSAVGTGHGVVGYFTAIANSGSPVFTITDNAGSPNTYIQPDAALLMSYGAYVGHFYHTNLSGNPTTLTVTATGGTVDFPAIGWDEFSTELAAGVTIDQHLRGPTSAGVATALANGMTTGNVTTTVDGELIFGWGIGIEVDFLRI